MATQHASDLIQDLSNVPNIVGGLGLSIASAQKAFDVEYLDSIARILAMAKSLLGGNIVGPDGKPFPEAVAFLQDMLTKLAPSRYQFTETTLSVRMDLAQSLQFAGSVGLGFGIGAISINAAFTLGYSYNYQAAAQCQTVLHAYPPDASVFNALLSRAGAVNDKSLEVPPRSQVDQALFDQNSSILQKLTGQAALPIKTKPSITKLDPATGKIGMAITVTASGFKADSTVDVFDSSQPPKKVESVNISNATSTSFQITLPAGTPLAAGDYQLQIVNSTGASSDEGDASKFTVTQ